MTSGNAAGGVVGPGVLLDISLSQGRPWLAPGTPTGAVELDRAAEFAVVQVDTWKIGVRPKETLAALLATAHRIHSGHGLVDRRDL